MALSVRNDLLFAENGQQTRFVKSPNTNGKTIAPQYLVMHYTAGRNAQSSIRTLTDPSHKASAHLVIGRDGSITQLMPFNITAWHAGESAWRGLKGLNRYSVGIELDNAGKLQKQGGNWTAWYGTTIPDSEVIEASHKFGGGTAGWHVFPEAQLTAAVEAARAIIAEYDMWDVVGHDDIAPSRKTDPGPAFPMESFRSAVLNRSDDQPGTLEAIAPLNLRTGPGLDQPKAQPKALAKGTRMQLITNQEPWLQVTVLGANGTEKATGWVHGQYVKQA